jgi:hypothetical protein
LLQARADIVGVAVARNDKTRYKIYWAMVIAEKPPKAKEQRVAAQEKRKVAAQEKIVKRREKSADSENPLSALKTFVCKYLC